MKLTRRKAIGLMSAGTAGAMAQQDVRGQSVGSAVTLNWLGGTPPSLACGVSWGVPLPRGTVAKNTAFSLEGTALPLQSWPLACWPDGSIKWMGFAASVGQNAGREFRLVAQPGGALAGLSAKTTAASIEIDTGKLQCNPGEVRPVPHLVDEDGRP